MARKHGKELEKLAAKIAQQLVEINPLLTWRKATAMARAWLEATRAIIKRKK